MANSIIVILLNVVYVLLVYSAIISQKHGALKSPKIGKAKGLDIIKGFASNKLWLLGSATALIGVPFSIFLFSITNLSYLMIFHKTGIILVIIYGLKVLDEKLTRLEITALVMIYGGFATVILWQEPRATSAYAADGPVMFLFAMLAILVLFCYLVFRYVKVIKKIREILLAICGSVCAVIGNMSMKLITLAISRDAIPGFIFNPLDINSVGIIFLGIFLPSSGYFFGSLYWYLWIISFSFNFLFTQMIYQYGRASFAIPLATSINFLAVVLFSVLLFNESLFTMSWVGVLIMAVGMFIVGQKETKIRMQKSPSNHEPTPESDSRSHTVAGND